ncbi:MAG: hypothetical protein OHK93_002685 [Ramalina farinacea]|uniref:Uncharacterized protein n=1 Tax=Ramalina farinacea TaxID=258253 RepID=A0AA43TU01_9LECA|nr:hypothetical protein [Ramalina farinacea]
MPAMFSKCYGLCKSCLNTCGQVLHISPNQSNKKKSISSPSSSTSSPLEKTTTNYNNNMSTITNNGTANKPTIVIAPGAWQNASVYDTLRAALSTLGYPSVCRSPPPPRSRTATPISPPTRPSCGTR